MPPIERLTTESDLNALVARIRTLSPDSPRKWGRMTCPQMVCHLSDALRARLGDIPPSKRRDNLLSRSVFKWLALHTRTPWPHGTPTSPEIDQAAGKGTRPAQFAGDVEQLITLTTRFVRQPSGALGPHPFFGPLSATEWSRWGWAHADHHLRQFGA
jgi:hypothetical protein